MPALPIELDPDGGRSVMAAIESLMSYRLRSDGFTAGRGGRETDHFDATTQPRGDRAEEVAARMAVTVQREYPGAMALLGYVAGEDDPTQDLVTIAALRAAIELEPSCPNPEWERVKSWREDLKQAMASMSGRFTANDGGGEGLEARWYFGEPDCDRAPGSEIPYDVYCRDRSRRRQW